MDKDMDVNICLLNFYSKFKNKMPTFIKPSLVETSIKFYTEVYEMQVVC